MTDDTMTAFLEDDVKHQILKLIQSIKPHAVVLMWISEDGECEQLTGGCERCIKSMLEEDWDAVAEDAENGAIIH